jgi:formylglycine-generating enzyme required for sulfatase activity
VIVIVLGLGFQQGWFESRATKLVKEARELFANKQIALSLTRLKNVAKIDPLNREATKLKEEIGKYYLTIGDQQFARKNYSQSIGQYQKAAPLLPDNAGISGKISQAKQQIAAIEKARQEKARNEAEARQKPIDSFNMVYVKGGTFQMGSNSGDSDEKPVHSVRVSNFYIGKYEVTQKQWKAIMGGNPSNWKGDNLPVENVSWNDVQEFLRKLNAKTGGNFRLPTEAEWEYACRGGTRSAHYKYAGSNNASEVAWYSGNSGSKTHPVGQKQANELGLYDMSGNVWEWCSDWYSKDYYKNSPSSNPRGPNGGTSRVYRGGSCYRDAGGLRVADRSGNTPDNRYSGLGFRLARTR